MTINWAEKLPENCPPEEAYPPNGQVFYRLVETIPPTEVDFLSTRSRSPNRYNGEVDECTMKACSIFNSYTSCSMVKKLVKPLKNHKIVKLVLDESCGLIKQTLSPNHYSWWRCADFDPLPNCVEHQDQ